MPRSNLPFVNPQSLWPHIDIAREGLDRGMDYKAIRTRIEIAHGVTTTDSAMKRWLRDVQARDARSPLQEVIMDGCLVVQSFNDLDGYDEWAQQFEEHGTINPQRLRRELQRRGLTTTEETLMEWCTMLDNKDTYEVTPLPQLESKTAWAIEKIKEHQGLSPNQLRRYCMRDHKCSPTWQTMNEWLDLLMAKFPPNNTWKPPSEWDY